MSLLPRRQREILQELGGLWQLTANLVTSFFIEQKVNVQVSSFAMALLVWFSNHYVFNLEYHKYYRDAAMFMQEFIFDLYESDVKQKKQNYLTAVTELQKCIEPPVSAP